MKLASFTTGDRERVGIVDDAREVVRDATGLLPGGPCTLRNRVGCGR